jgi:VanZ family protein
VSPRRARWALLAWMATIFIASSIPGDSMPGAQIFRLDKVIHFGVFGVLGALAAWALPRAGGQVRWWLAWLITTAWGACDELHQWFVPGRYVELLDLVADSAGGLVGGLAVYMWARRRIDPDASGPIS